MLASSICDSGCVGPINAERCFSSALRATEVTLTVVIGAAKRAAANNGAKPTGGTSKAKKAGSTIEIVSDSIDWDTTHPPRSQITFS